MQFEVTILGCGAATPTLRHAPTAQAINWHGKWILLDCGEGVQTNIRKYKIPLQKIELICISHLHGDHVFGLPGLLGSMNLFGRERPLRIVGPVALKDYVFQALNLTETHIRFPIEYTDCADSKGIPVIAWGDNAVRSFPVKHRIEAYGFTFSHHPTTHTIRKESIVSHHLLRSEILSLKAGNELSRATGEVLRITDHCEPLKPSISYSYSGDTRPCDSVLVASQEADVLYHEATFLHDMSSIAKSTGHSTAQEAAKLGREANVQLLILGHLSSRYRDEGRVLKEAECFHPNVRLAKEGMRIRLIPGEKPSVSYLE
ncbi:MAG: ribonuclease [Crocinitomicaceae bacterium]|nr:ribonuclease [Crocinitomicaceae bacterium]